jgi:transcriptional regulator GlxA family with amidase domain
MAAEWAHGSAMNIGIYIYDQAEVLDFAGPFEVFSTASIRQQFPQLEVWGGRRWVDAETVVTSGGISAGIDMSLYLVSKLHSLALAEKTARQMEFDWFYPSARAEKL